MQATTPRKKLFHRLIFPALLLVLLQTGRSPAEVGAFPRTVTDADGVKISIPRQPKRIIALSAGITEILFSYNLGDYVIGVIDACNYPPEAVSRQKVGNVILNYEKIIALKPDLIIIEKTMHPREIPKLRRFNVPLVAVNSDTYTGFLESLKIIGQATGKEKEAEISRQNIVQTINNIEKQVEGIPEHRKMKVFVEIWNQPLMTAGGDTFINFIITTTGGISISRELSGFPGINPEILLVKNPDVIILTTSKTEDFLANPLWKNVSAVKNRRVHRINPDIFVRPTLRLPEGCRLLVEWLRAD